MRTGLIGLTIVGVSGLGLILALIVEEMNSQGILIDDLLTGTIVISDVLTWFVLIFLVAGVLIAVWRYA